MAQIESVEAQFKGTDYSMGFRTGLFYKLVLALYVDGHMAIFCADKKNPNKQCPYDSYEAFLENWEVVYRNS